MRPDWDFYFLGICEAVAERADCTRRKVGAVIVKDHRIVSTGYNGAPAGHNGCLAGACPRGKLSFAELPQGSPYDGNCIAVHAEANAIIYGDYDRMRNADLYCTDFPCDGCMKLIWGAGIIRLVTPGVIQILPSSSTSPAQSR